MLLAYFVSLAYSKNSERLGNWGWRLALIFQLLAPTIIIPTIWFCPESPRWYIKKDRIEEAVEALQLVRDDRERVQAETTDIFRAIQYEKDNNVTGDAALWTDRSVRKRLRRLNRNTN